MNEQALIEAGYYQDSTGHWVKDARTTIVKTDNGDVEVKGGGYIPSYKSYAEPTVDTNPESATPSRAQQIYLQQVANQKTVAEEKARKAEAKIKLQSMTKREAIKFKNENGLNDNLTQAENLQRQQIMKQHRQAREEQRQRQQLTQAPIHGGDTNVLLRTVRQMTPAQRKEFMELFKEVES